MTKTGDVDEDYVGPDRSRVLGGDSFRDPLPSEEPSIDRSRIELVESDLTGSPVGTSPRRNFSERRSGEEGTPSTHS